MESFEPERPATARHAGAMLIATVIVAALNYALNIILGWVLPLAAYGQVGVIQTIIFLGTWFLAAGFPWVVNRAVAQAHGAPATDGGPGTAAWRTFKTAWLANTVLTVAVAGIGLPLAYSAGWLRLGPDYAPLVLLAALTIGALGLSAVPDAALQGLFRFGLIARWRVVEVGFNTLVSVTLLVLGFGATGALAGFAAAAVLACALNLWSLRDTGYWRAPGWGGVAAVRTALPLTVGVFGGILLTNIDLLAIKFLSGAAGADALAGTYAVAAVLARAPLFISQALVGTYYPRLAQESAGAGNSPAARELRRWLALGVLPLNLTLAVTAPTVVSFFFPARFAAAAGPLAVLALGSAALAWAGAEAAIRQAQGRPAGPAAVMGLAVAGQLVALALWVPAWGALGAASASTVASMLACALLLVRKQRAVALVPLLWRNSTALIVLALCAGVPTQLFPQAERLIVAVWMILVGALYVAVCFLLNLLDATLLNRLSSASPGWIGTAGRSLLALAVTLNRIGQRWGATARGESVIARDH